LVFSRNSYQNPDIEDARNSSKDEQDDTKDNSVENEDEKVEQNIKPVAETD
jgi:hypothetical protein